MKTIFTKQGTLLILMILILTALCFSCKSGDDAPNDAVLCDTFLECNDGIIWKYIELENSVEIARIYFRLNKDLTNPIESWITFFTMNCYDAMHISEHQFQIIENTNDKLILKITWLQDDWQQDEFETWTFTKQVESLKLVQKYFEEEIIIISNKTSDDVTNLQLCVN